MGEAKYRITYHSGDAVLGVTLVDGTMTFGEAIACAARLAGHGTFLATRATLCTVALIDADRAQPDRA